MPFIYADFNKQLSMLIQNRTATKKYSFYNIKFLLKFVADYMSLYFLILKNLGMKYLIITSVLFVFFVFLYFSSNSQNQQTIDSLKTLILQDKEDTLKAKHLNDLVWYIKFINPDTSLKLLDESEILSKKLDFADGLGNSYNNRAIIYTIQGNFDDALKYYNLANEQFIRNNDTEGIGFCLSNIAICFEFQSLFDSAINYNKKALAIRKKYGLQNGIAQSNINIGVIYFNKGFYRISLQHYQAALEFYENKPEKTAIDRSYLGSVQNNIGNIYLELNITDKARKYFEDAMESYKNNSDSRELAYLYNDLGDVEKLSENYAKAFKYYFNALGLATEIRDKPVRVITLLNISSNYLDIDKPDSAMHYARIGITTAGEINDKKYSVGLYQNMGKIYLNKGMITIAINNYKKALEMADEASIIKQKDKILYDLSQCYAALGNYKKANSYLKLHIEAADSVMNEDKHRQIAEMEALYENEKNKRQLELKEAENKILQRENEIQAALLSGKNRLIISITVGLLMISGILFLLIIQYRRKNAAYKILVRKNLELINVGKNTKNNNKAMLKNGELFASLQKKLEDEKLYCRSDINQEFLADLLNTNRTYLSQSISDHAGKKFRQFINEYRIKEAMLKLSDPNISKKYTINTIAEEVGFNSISVFNTVFKQLTGLKPSDFRGQAGSR